MKAKVVGAMAALLVAAGLAGMARAASPYPLDQTFLLHSYPGASKVIYLDFNGHTTTGTSWNSMYTGGAAIVTPPFSIDGDSSFSDIELERIQYIWQRVTEDYIPFGVDVTTQDPGVAGIVKSGTGDSFYGIRVCIGGGSSWYPGAAIGGIAMIGGFGPSSDTPCFVFSNNLAISNHGNEKYVAEAISHEVGHTLNLGHDGASGVEYYQGQGSGPTGWAPIMGNAYYKDLTQWSKGEYPGANNPQNDLTAIASLYPGGFGYRADDHGGTIASATALIVAGGRNVSGSGIIERQTDVDFFSFATEQGLVSLMIDPAPRGPNLDILATLYDSSGAVLAVSNPIGALNASFSLSLLAGMYYLSIDGTGEGDPLVSGYSDYGSLGQYFISGTVAVPEPATLFVMMAAGLPALLKRRRRVRS